MERLQRANRDRPAGPHRVPAGRSVPNGPSDRFGSLKARITIGVVVGAIALLLLDGAILGRAFRGLRDLERTQYATIATDARLRIDRLASRDRTRLSKVAFSDELYALLTNGPIATDSFIRPNFTERFAVQHGDRFVGIYDLAGRRLFAWHDPAGADLEPVAATNPFFRILENREAAAGLIRRGEDLYWIAGAPVLPAHYTDTSQPILGYVIVAQPFPTGSLGALGERIGGVTLTPYDTPKTPYPTRVDAAPGRDSVVVRFTLPDIFAEQTTLAALTRSRAEFRTVEARLGWVLLVAAAVILGLAALAWLGLIRWLVDPLHRLAAGVEPAQKSTLPTLLAPVSTATEWNELTGSLNRLIANARAVQERVDRRTGLARDGVFERDLVTGEWTVNERFRELIGYRESDFPNPLAALVTRIHPEDAPVVIGWLEASPPSPPTLAVETRVRRLTGDLWLKFEAAVAVDAAGLPIRIDGRVSDATERRVAESAIAAARSDRVADRQATGRFLATLAASLPPGPVRGPLEVVGKGLAGTLGSSPETFDLIALLQDLALDRELTIVPGVPERVTGDRGQLAAALTLLLEAGSPEVAFRAEPFDRARPSLIRFTIEERGARVEPEALDRTRRALAVGEADGPDPLLACRALHHLAAALGGTADVESDATGVRRFIVAALEPAPVAPPSPEPTAPGRKAEPEGGQFWDMAPAGATFDTSGRPSRPSQRVELVADATVTVDFDEPAAALPVSAEFRARLGAAEAEALRQAQTALAEIPYRLRELAGAIKAGEVRTSSQVLDAIERTAGSVGAIPTARAARDLLDVIEGQYLDAAEEPFRRLEAIWGEAAAILTRFRGEAVAPPPPASPIDPATLEQLRASVGNGGGLGAQLVAHFLAEVPSRLEAIERAVGHGDEPALVAAANDLKGICGLIGAHPLAARCSRVAQATGPGAVAEARAIRAEWHRVERVLTDLTAAVTGA